MKTLPGSHQDLLNGTNTAVFTTIGDDGLPQSTAVWFLARDGQIEVSTRKGLRKFHNVQARPVACVFILDPANPWRFIEVRGSITWHEDPTCELRDAVAAKHGMDGSKFDPPGTQRVRLVLTPERINCR